MSTHSRQIWEAAESELRSQLSAALARASAAEGRADAAGRAMAIADEQARMSRRVAAESVELGRAAYDRAEQAERELAKRDAVRWCSCGRPWIPAAGLYGTTEQTECGACVLQRSLKQAERERDEAEAALTSSVDAHNAACIHRDTERRRALLLGAGLRDERTRAEHWRDEWRKLESRKGRWRHACLCACKRGDEWRASYGDVCLAASSAEQESDRLRAELYGIRERRCGTCARWSPALGCEAMHCHDNRMCCPLWTPKGGKDNG